MARKRKASQASKDAKAVRTAARAEAIANGTWRPRAARFADKRAVARRKACRGSVSVD